MFSEEIAENFFFVFTFADGDEPPAWKVISDEEDIKTRIIDRIKGEQYQKINNSAIFKRIDETKTFDKMFWDLGMKCIDLLFKKINETEVKALGKSVQVID